MDWGQFADAWRARYRPSMDRVMRGELPWDCMLSAELDQVYKPDPRVYQMAVRLLGLQRHEVLLVAAHQEDLRAAQAQGMQADFVGVSVHDGWSSYWQFLCQRALCNVHHLRELTFLEEELRQAWAGEMKELLLDIKAAVEQARTEGRTSLHPLEVADWKACYGAGLSEGYQANPPDPPPEASKKGRRKQLAARNLLARLSKHQGAGLAFLDNFAVPFDK